MAYGISEFEERIKEICDRWYVKGGAVLKIMPDGSQDYIYEPVQVWERPYANGPGFMGDTLVLNIDAWENYHAYGMWLFPDPRHLYSLRKMHWNRTQENQFNQFREVIQKTIKLKEASDRMFAHECEQYAASQRESWRKASRELGLKKFNIEKPEPIVLEEKMVFKG